MSNVLLQLCLPSENLVNNRPRAAAHQALYIVFLCEDLLPDQWNWDYLNEVQPDNFPCIGFVFVCLFVFLSFHHLKKKKKKKEKKKLLMNCFLEIRN